MKNIFTPLNNYLISRALTLITLLALSVSVYAQEAAVPYALGNLQTYITDLAPANQAVGQEITVHVAAEKSFNVNVEVLGFLVTADCYQQNSQVIVAASQRPSLVRTIR